MTAYSHNNYLRSLKGLGDAPPVIKFSTEPDKSADGREVDWSCSDWVTWHKELVKAFMAGSFTSGIKYSQKDAIEQSNKVFRQWWDKANSWFGYNKSWCGYESLFSTYLQSVGLDDLLTLPQKVLNPVAETVVNVVESASTVTKNVASSAENASEAVKKTTGAIKWLLPTAVVLGVGGVCYYVYKNYMKGNRKIKAAGVEI